VFDDDRQIKLVLRIEKVFRKFTKHWFTLHTKNTFICGFIHLHFISSKKCVRWQIWELFKQTVQRTILIFSSVESSLLLFQKIAPAVAWKWISCKIRLCRQLRVAESDPERQS